MAASFNKNGIVSCSIIEERDKVSVYKNDIVVNPNILLASNRVTGGSNASGITSSYEQDGSLKIIATSGNSNYRSIYFAKNSNDSVGANLKVGDTYTISLDLKIEVGTKLPTLFINGGNDYKQLLGDTNLIGKWQQVYYTSTWAEPGTSYGNISLHLGFGSAIGTYYVKNFKLEKGDIATPWCPNSADGYGAIAVTTMSNPMSINEIIEY